MDPNISTFIQENKHVLKRSINLTDLKDFIKNYLPTLSHTGASNEPDFYDELVKQGNYVFLQFLEALKENKYKMEAEWIEANLKKIKNNETRSPSKGLCLIINNIKFDQNARNLKDRKYSIIDEIALKKAFTKIGFKVYVRQNLKAEEITKELKSFCCYSPFSSSFVVVILTHGDNRGNQDVLYGTDIGVVSKDDVIIELNSTEYENMFEKHKIVIFQACRGQKEYYTAQGLETDAAKENENPIPEMKITSPSKIVNTTIVHSALPGHKCHTLKNKGSVFCQTLAKVLVRDHKKHDLNTMLVTVNKEIRERFPRQEEFLHIEHIGVTERIHFGDTLTQEP